MADINQTELIKLLHESGIRYPIYTSYIILGSLAILINVIIIIVIFSNRKLRRKSSMIIGLAGGNLFNGIHAFGFGLYRMPLLLSDQLDQSYNIWLCLATLLPLSGSLGFIVPATMQCAIGLERLVAITAFNWYRVNWLTKKSWHTVVIIYCICIFISIAVILYEAFSNTRIITKECSSAMVLPHLAQAGVRYSVTAGLAGMVCVLTAIVVGYLRVTKLSSHGNNQSNISNFKRQWHFSKIMSLVILCDCIFIVLPNLMLDLKMSFKLNIPTWIAAYAIPTYCCNSVVNVIIYVIMNTEFRKILKSKILNCFCFRSNVVVPESTAAESRL